MIDETRLSYILREMLLKRGIKNLLEFTGLVSEKGLKLANNDSLTPANLQSSLEDKDRGFFNSNKISRKSFYRTAVALIKKEMLIQKRKKFSEDKERSGVSIFGSQFHFGRGDNVKGNKTNIRSNKESFVEKFFWYGFVALVVAILAIIISRQLGFT